MNIRLKIDGNETRLVYQRGMILEHSRVIEPGSLRGIFYQLKQQVKEARRELRYGDILNEKETGSILTLLRRKRREKSRACFKSKKPLNSAKHIGVEIEFISASDREEIALDLTALNLSDFVELKSDASVSGGDTDCDGSCRGDCNCYDCGEIHHCDDEEDCRRQTRMYGSIDDRTWSYREDCEDCDDCAEHSTETESIDGCECAGTGCLGTHIVCVGHCPGHYCNGSEDHPNAECRCDCTCNSHTGHEIAIVAKSTQITDIINKVCQVLQKHNAEVNNTCGLHVHLDMRHANVDRAFGNLFKSQKLLYAMVPISRKRNDYCRPNMNPFRESYTGRYYGINPTAYNEHKTLEVRLHSGTINADKINNWIRLLRKIAYSKKPLEINKLSDLTNNVKISAELLTYIQTRLKKFKNEHNGDFIDDLSDPQQNELIAA